MHIHLCQRMPYFYVPKAVCTLRESSPKGKLRSGCARVRMRQGGPTIERVLMSCVRGRMAVRNTGEVATVSGGTVRGGSRGMACRVRPTAAALCARSAAVSSASARACIRHRHLKMLELEGTDVRRARK